MSDHTTPDLETDGPAVPEGREPVSVVGEPSDEELVQLAIDTRLYRFQATAGDPIQYEMSEQQVHAFARAVLARFGHHTAPVPVPVDERLPRPGDCITNPRNGQGQWCWGWVQHDPIPYSGRWRMIRREWLADEAVAWLPAHALPLPQGEVE